jgi:hypothetical protein
MAKAACSERESQPYISITGVPLSKRFNGIQSRYSGTIPTGNKDIADGSKDRDVF